MHAGVLLAVGRRKATHRTCGLRDFVLGDGAAKGTVACVVTLRAGAEELADGGAGAVCAHDEVGRHAVLGAMGVIERHSHGITAILESGQGVTVEMRGYTVRGLALWDGTVVALDAVEIGA